MIQLILMGLVMTFSLKVPFAHAQAAFPTKPIRLITYAAPGGALDLMSRIVAQCLTEQMKQAVVVENRPGAAGNVGASIVAKAPPDGYTIGMATSATHGINPTLYGKRMPFNAIKDFAPIGLAAELQNVLVVNASLPVKNLSEFVLYARAHPGLLSYGSSGNGTSQHLAGEMFKRVSQIDVVHIPYKGLSQAVQALMSGDLQFMFSTVSDALPHIRSGKLRAIGLASLKRSSLLPDITPIAEMGYPGFNVVSWFGFVAPAGTPAEIVKRYNQELLTGLEDPKMRSKLAQMGLEVSTDSPEQFASFIESEITKWAVWVNDSGASEP